MHNAHIRSFVLRQGRVSNAQRRALDALLPVHGVTYREQRLDLDVLFGRSAAKIMEIGFGMGETTARIAAAHPDQDYLAVEVHSPGVGALLKIIDESGLRNIRIIQHDAMDVLQHMIGASTLDGAHVFFPDPWPKKRHHKRRLLQPPFLTLLAQRLRPGGYLHVATDWQEYAQWVLLALSAEPLLTNTANGFAPRPEGRPLTKFEARGLLLGHGVWDIVFRRTT